MKILWDKIPERIHSESLKCLLCHTMKKTLQTTGDFRISRIFCHALMIIALTMDDNEAFESEAKLKQALMCNRSFHNPLKEDETVFLHQHKEYFLECTLRVLKSVEACPDKPHNRRRSECP